MARQLGDIKVTGTIEGLSFYKMYGDYFVRTKSSLTGKRFWKDNAFEGSRKSCSLLAKASPIASLFYKTYPVQMKKRGLFNEMTGRVKQWLKEGNTEEQAFELLKKNYPVKQKQTAFKNNSSKVKKAVAQTRIEKLFTVLVYKDIPRYQKKTERKKQYSLKE